MMRPRMIQTQRDAGQIRVRVWVIAGALLGSSTALADDIDWSNVNGGLFNVGTNWIGGIVPGAADFALFGRTRPGNPQQVYTVSFSTNPTNQGVVVEDDAVTFNLLGHAYSLTQTIIAMQVGTVTGRTGRLTLTNGVMATPPDAGVSIGQGTNSAGVLTISTGAQLLGPRILVGDNSPGTLIVQSGGDIVGGRMAVGSPFGAFTGTVAIAGAGSVVVAEGLFVGGIGSGTVNITAGGRIESTEGALGLDVGIGTVNVDGVNSRWTSSGPITVGYAGRGALNMTAGGRVQSQGGLVGSFQGNGTVAMGGGSQWIMTDQFVVGSGGPGTITIAGGSLVQNTAGTIGSDQPTSGFVTIDGPGSQWINTSDLTVGEQDSGTLFVTAGGEVRSVDGFIARYGGQGSARVSGAGSRWTMTGDLSVGGDYGQGITGGTGTLLIDAGGSLTAGILVIYPQGVVTLLGGTLDVGAIGLNASGGVFSFLGGVLHAGGIVLNCVNHGGTLAPGRSAGTTSISGTYTQQSGTMEIEIGGTAPGTQFDRVLVNGTASLGGTLDLRLINGFVPSAAQTFVVLDATGITGAFANAASGQRVAVSSGGGSFVVHYGPGSPFDPTTITLSGFGPCPSDFNGDGFLDFFDADAFVACFEGSGCPPGQDADFNDDGFMDFFDADAFVEAFEAGC